MAATIAQTCGSLTVLLNSDLKGDGEGAKWLEECRKYRPGYVPAKEWELNKTLIYKYREPTARVLGLDVFLKEAVLVVPLGTEIISRGILEDVVEYLVGTIRCICPVAVANEMGFRLTVYLPMLHEEVSAMQQCDWLTAYNNPWSVTTLGKVMDEPMKRFELVFKLDNNWKVIKNKRVVTNEPFQVGPCFRPPQAAAGGVFGGVPGAFGGGGGAFGSEVFSPGAGRVFGC